MSQKPKQNLFKLLDTKSVAYVGYVDADNPLTVFATKMPENCQIQFEKIEFSDDVISTACGCDVGELLVDVLSIDPYKLCNCTPLIDSKNKSIVIDAVGHYQAVIAGDCIGEVEAWVKQSPELKGEVTDIQRGCCKPCEHIEFSLTEVTQTSVKVQLIKGSQATVKLFNGSQSFEQISEENLQILPFNGLEAGKTYSILVENECDKASVNFTTGEPAPVPPCPTLSITAVVLSDTSIKVTVNSGGPAIVTVGDQEAEITTNHTFVGLQAGKTYTAKGVNECGKKSYSTVTTTSPPPPPEPEPIPCPSKHLKSFGFNGYAYATGDLIDPLATVDFNGFKLYPSAGLGHTVKVTNEDGDTIGFASNQSDCAPPCGCEPENIEPQKTVLVNDATLDGVSAVCAIVESSGKYTYQARTGTIINGSANIENGPASYIQKTYTNTTKYRSLLEVTGVIQANIVDITTPSNKATFIHGLSEQLNILPTGGSYPFVSNFVWTNIDEVFPNTEASGGWVGAGNYSQQTQSIVFRKILEPNESVTVYGQWWVVVYNGGVVTFHGGMALYSKLFVNIGDLT